MDEQDNATFEAQNEELPPRAINGPASCLVCSNCLIEIQCSASPKTGSLTLATAIETRNNVSDRRGWKVSNNSSSSHPHRGLWLPSTCRDGGANLALTSLKIRGGTSKLRVCHNNVKWRQDGSASLSRDSLTPFIHTLVLHMPIITFVQVLSFL